MIIITVDNEIPALNILNRAVKEAVPDAQLLSFTKASEVVSAVRDRKVSPDVVFLDIEMPGMSGLEVAQMIKSAHPLTNIIFVTSYSQYAMEALAQRPSGYILKPATKDKILEELKNLRHPPKRVREAKPIRVHCFGSFDIFVNGEPVQFLRAKSKELLAYLVDRRGASCSASEIASVLWDDEMYDRSRQKQLSVIRSDLIKSLHIAGADDILIKGHDMLAVNRDAFDCDYYMALEGDVVSINSFIGEYMAPYMWAEFTTGLLNSKYGNSLQEDLETER